MFRSDLWSWEIDDVPEPSAGQKLVLPLLRSKQAGLPGFSSSCLMRAIVNKTVHVVITGRVQGVAYRYWTQSEALRRELTGFVRNRWDGNVGGDVLRRRKTGGIDGISLLEWSSHGKRQAH